MATVLPLLDAEATCASCSSDNELEYNTGCTEIGQIIEFDRKLPLAHEFADLNYDSRTSSHLTYEFDFSLYDEFEGIGKDLTQNLLIQYQGLRDTSLLEIGSFNIKSSILKLPQNHNYERFYDLPPEMIIDFSDTVSTLVFEYISTIQQPYRVSKSLSGSNRNIESTADVDRYLSKHSMLDHLIRLAIETVEEELFFDQDKFKLNIYLSQDPECMTPDIRLSIESNSLDFDTALNMWEKLSGVVEETIRKSAILNKLSEKEIEDVLDTFTISVMPSRN